METEYRKATAGTKVTCRICNKKFYPDKLRMHRYKCTALHCTALRCSAFVFVLHGYDRYFDYDCFTDLYCDCGCDCCVQEIFLRICSPIKRRTEQDAEKAEENVGRC